MPDRAFFEEYPLYKKKARPGEGSYLRDLGRPSLHLPCEICKSDQTFNPKLPYTDPEGSSGGEALAGGRTFLIIYACASCDRFRRYYLVRFDAGVKQVWKVGQWPPWEIGMGSRLEAMLGEHVDSYRKGLISESQSYGIGAFAYYRRVVENVIDTLLDAVATLIPEA